MLKSATALTGLLIIAPILAGLGGTMVLAFGNAQVWLSLFAAPGIGTSILLSLCTGVAATLLSLALVIVFCAAYHDTRIFHLFRRLIGPLLAVPHAAMAIGIAFLLAPSGWLMRLVSPWATGFDRPPDLALVQDPFGLALIFGLVVKETPFLFLMTLAALNQVDARRSVLVARSLGYAPGTAWVRTVWPQLYPQLRLPIFAVLAFSLSIVDMALILAPNTPPPLAVQIMRWAQDPDLAIHQQAAAAGCLLLAMTLAAIGCWFAAERVTGMLGRSGRRRDIAALRWLAGGGGAVIIGAACLAMGGMALWSVATGWRFPDPLPSGWTLAHWSDAIVDLQRPFLMTLGIGLLAVGIAIVLVIACLEAETRGRFGRRLLAPWLIYAPLLVPQISFLFGVQHLLVLADIDGSWLAVTWSHLLFVLPYVALSLSDPYRALDARYARTAQCLGASPLRVFFRIRLPMLLRPVLVAAAVGFSVSVAQYLPTLFAGAGRFATLTTEAVTLSSGGDRRVTGLYAVLQASLPLIGFALALTIPAWLYRQRAGMRAFR